MPHPQQTLLCSALLLLSACASVADMAGYDSRTLNAYSAQAYAETIREARSEGALDTQSATARRVRHIFARLVPPAQANNRTGLPFAWEINVIRSRELNAFAMPGGKLVISTGIIERLLLSDDEIAAIIGHEMAHALLEHSKAEFGQKILTQIGIGIGGKVLQDQTGFDTDMIDLGTALAGDLGISKPYSRRQEYEADHLGLLLMADAGYHPPAAVSLWQKMRNAQGRSTGPEIFSTHPADEGRIQALQAAMPQAMALYQNARAYGR